MADFQKNNPGFELIQAPIVKVLPEDIAAGLGHVVSRWARLEAGLRSITYLAAGVDHKRGRVAIRQPHLEDQITMIEDLLTLRNLHLTSSLTKFKKTVSDLQKLRDRLAHGLWVEHPETHELGIQSTSGNWNVGPGQPRQTRRMHPEGQAVDRADLDAIAEQIEAAIKKTVQIYFELATGLKALHEKQIAQIRKGYPPPDQIESKPQDPPFPSQG